MQLSDGWSMPDANCPECGQKFDMAAMVDDDKNQRRPRHGDITVCIGCGHLMAFGEGLALRPLTDSEMIYIAGDPRLINLQRARLEARLEISIEREERKKEKG